MKIILFENDNVENLYPITLTRPSFDIMCGGTTLYKAMKAEFPEATFDFSTREYLQALVNSKFKATKADDQKTLFIDSSVAPDIEIIKKLGEMVKKDQPFKVKIKDNYIVTYLSDLNETKDFDQKNLDVFLSKLNVEEIKLECKTFEKLPDVIVINKEILGNNLEYLKQGLDETKPGVFVGKGVIIEGHVIFDTSAGPIIINEGSRVNSFTVLRGPLYVGKNSQINSFSEIKSNTCLGEVCKVGGEVSGSIVQGYSNKQHAGFLGDSYVGSWVNLGGGTSNSNMKNTLGTIKMAGVDTGQQFLGCIIGDHCKTALNVSIFTGKVIGVNSLLYGTITQDVPSFSNAGTLLKHWVGCPLELAQRIQASIFERRKQKVTEFDIKLLTDIFEMTKQDRKAAKVKEGKIEFVS